MKKYAWIACVILWHASPGTTQAGVIVNIQEFGSNVVVTGSGTINTTALSNIGTTNNFGLVEGGFPLGSFVVVGPTQIVSQQVYSGITGPPIFGTGPQFRADSGAGNTFGVVANNVLDLPIGYVSGSFLKGTSTYSGQTVSSLGLTPGTYVYTWGSGSSADSFAVNISPVPEPATLTLLGIGIAGMAGYAWRRKRQRATV
jgi:hypothetical protein